MERFDIKEFLTENKLTEQSVQLDELKSNVELKGDMEGLNRFERRIKSSAQNFSYKPPVKEITVEELGAQFDSNRAWIYLELSNGDEIQYEHERGRTELYMIVDGDHIEPGSRLESEINGSDAPVQELLDYYKAQLAMK